MNAAPKPGSWLKNQVDRATSEPKQDLSKTGSCDTASVERWLQKFGVQYSHLLDLPLARIDEKKSRQNQARETAVIDDSVNRYVAALKSGDEFPPVVGYLNGTRVVLIDGNNRDAAHRRAGMQTIRAYVLSPDTPSETILAMTVDANAHHGVTPPLPWRIQQAVHLISLGFSIDQVVEWSAVTANQIKDYRRITQAEQRAKTLRVHGFSELPAYAKLKLGAVTSEPVFIQASRVAIDTSMTVADVTEFIRDLKTYPDEKTQVEFIGETADRRKMEANARSALGKKPPIKSPRQGLITGLGKIMAADPAAIARSTLTDVERHELIKRANDAGERLIEIIIALDSTRAEDIDARAS